MKLLILTVLMLTPTLALGDCTWRRCDYAWLIPYNCGPEQSGTYKELAEIIENAPKNVAIPYKCAPGSEKPKEDLK